MGVRQSLNENPVFSTIATIVVIVVALGFIYWRLNGTHPRRPAIPTKMYYSDDDGKTYFADEANKLTPFIGPNNKPAVQVMVFQCGGDPFVAWLSKYTDEGRQIAQKLLADPRAPEGIRPLSSLMEVKKPGGKVWVRFDPQNVKAYADVTTPRCPDGGSQVPRPVLPPP